MKISRLHYISQEINGKSHLENITEACEAGVDWIQLRVKNKSKEEIKNIGLQARIVCDTFKVKFIVNDFPLLAKEINADGVHLGKTDMSLLEARRLLGDGFIIGGTANSFEDIKILYQEGVDYIGLGPFRYTDTKENLSPIIGLKGYKEIIDECADAKISIPIIAIGGILPGDVNEIIKTGIYGIAVSGAINKAIDKKVVIEELKYSFQNQIV